MIKLTASKLYSYTQCPHRVWRDVYGPQEEKIKDVNPFVELLWNRGIVHEEKVVASIGEYLDLSSGTHAERFNKTMAAMKDKVPLIYQGVLQFDNLEGIPDLIKFQPDGSYIPIEIKSGMGYEDQDEESGDEGRIKKQYAVQICLYIDLLEKLNFEHKNIGQIIDGHLNLVDYDASSIINKKTNQTAWQFYLQAKNNVELLLSNLAKNKPAYSSKCKLCPWYYSCKKWVKESEDLSGMFDIGQSKRDRINEDLGIYKIKDLITIDIKAAIDQKKKDKNFLYRIGEESLKKIVRRAIIVSETKKPIIYEKITFPQVDFELYFDIEDDPTQEFVYLHGVYERSPNGERFLDFTARSNTKEAEKEAWQGFWNYIRSLPRGNFSVYYYSSHEKTTYRKMQKQYPNVVSEDELEDFFDHPNTIDLYYDIVLKNTDWPLPSYSIKEIAVYLGFKWRDETPSGALSIQWFNDYLETNNQDVLKRILEYNEDDCKAMMVLKDGLVELSNKIN